MNKPILNDEKTNWSNGNIQSWIETTAIKTTTTDNVGSILNIENNSDHWLELLKLKAKDPKISEGKRAYYNRMLKVLDMPDLSEQIWHPINLIIKKIIDFPFYDDFSHSKSPEIVWEWETFDLFNFPENHVVRRESDTYFIQKTEDHKTNMLLRPHTSVIWYYYLIDQLWKEELFRTGETKTLSWGKVYRVDKLDKTHHECFYQIDWLRLTSKEKEVINQDTLKEVIVNTIVAIFWEWVEYRFSPETYPYTYDSLQVEVKYKWKWIEILWGWVVHPSVLEKLWIDPEKYNWWAYGFGLDRLAMLFKWINDIRILWSTDPRITSQWWNFKEFKEVSSFPPVYKDISILVPKADFVKDEQESKISWEFEFDKETESNWYAISWLIRDAWGELIEEVKIIDTFENDKKFWEDYKSISFKITFRSVERTLTNEEINKIYFEIRKNIEDNLWYKLR